MPTCKNNSYKEYITLYEWIFKYLLMKLKYQWK